jgi:hypothetical protein
MVVVASAGPATRAAARPHKAIEARRCFEKHIINEKDSILDRLEVARTAVWMMP